MACRTCYITLTRVSCVVYKMQVVVHRTQYMVRAIKDPKPSCSSRRSLKKPLQPLLKMFPADGHGDPIAWAVVYRALAGFYLGLIRALGL